MTNKLAPCKCGGKAEVMREGSLYFSCLIRCADCDHSIVTMERYEECGREWNRQMAPPKTSQEGSPA